MTRYTIEHPDGSYRGVEVEEFKEKTETYIRERTDLNRYFLRIDQRLYRDGRWLLRIHTPWYPNIMQFNKRYKFRWDYYDIKELLDKVIEDYEEYKEWINSHE